MSEDYTACNPSKVEANMTVRWGISSLLYEVGFTLLFVRINRILRFLLTVMLSEKKPAAAAAAPAAEAAKEEKKEEEPEESDDDMGFGLFD
ncbi:unnamed protein product [Colias eurytheme]|nr:unnamed protein product [Colias eurytheme]